MGLGSTVTKLPGESVLLQSVPQRIYIAVPVDVPTLCKCHKHVHNPKGGFALRALGSPSTHLPPVMSSLPCSGLSFGTG